MPSCLFQVILYEKALRLVQDYNFGTYALDYFVIYSLRFLNLLLITTNIPPNFKWLFLSNEKLFRNMHPYLFPNGSIPDVESD